VVTLALLLLAGGLVMWHWQRDGYPWTDREASSPPAKTAPSNESAQAAAPAPTPAPTPAATKPATSPPANPAPVVPEPKSQPEPQVQNHSSEETPAPVDSSPSEAKPEDNNAEAPTTTADAGQPAAVVPPPVVAKPKPEPKTAPPPAAVLKGDDKLVADGERYLYGNGVPENCELAEKNLRVAAGHANARALTLMGAMYATGHCVNRDLPTAYRWFAKALRQDPSNTRVQQDLEILWKQMTPEERQLATKAGG